MSKDFKGKNRRDGAKPESEFEQKIIDLARVTRVMAGGKRMRFRAAVAIGDKKGRVGFGLAKGADVTIAVNKAALKAKKALIAIPFINDTIPHEIRYKLKAARLLMKPAPRGTGIKAGGAMRMIFELAGAPNVVGKILGTGNKIVVVQAMMEALTMFKSRPALKKQKVEKETEEVKAEEQTN
jgi:small subunit ribosomal protein S5